MANRLIGLAVILLTIAIDQLHKWWMLEVVHIADSPPIAVTPFFNLVMVWNRGISFGMFSGHSGQGAMILSLVAVVIVAFLLSWLWRCHDRWLAVALGLVIGGAIGNVIDRLRFGAVADFFDLHVAGYHWPAFNLADSAIFVGVMILLADHLFRRNRSASP